MKIPPLYGFLCPDWMKWSEIQEFVFSLLLNVQGEGEIHGLLTNKEHCNTYLNKADVSEMLTG